MWLGETTSNNQFILKQSNSRKKPKALLPAIASIAQALRVANRPARTKTEGADP
jgi:hypothetical protein